MKHNSDEGTDYCTKNCEHEEGYPCIYIDRCKLEREALVRISKEMAGLCLRCPHRNDGHSMNCMECCPIQAVIDHLANLTGKTVTEADGHQYVTHTHTVLCNTKKLPRIR